VMLLGEANREAPAQAELRPTCAGPAMSKRQRVEWFSCLNSSAEALLRQKAEYPRDDSNRPRSGYRFAE
jgi:hypothetical protein